MKAKIDPEKCIMCGSCVAICPEVFEMGDDGKVKVKAEVSEEVKEKVEQAKSGCPAVAIETEE
ncbi:MAG: ferredoxin [Candidatus Dojkabacteria bacterium]|jgi:ferredoxin